MLLTILGRLFAEKFARANERQGFHMPDTGVDVSQLGTVHKLMYSTYMCEG